MHASWATERCQPCDDGLGLERGRWRAGRSNRMSRASCFQGTAVLGVGGLAAVDARLALDGSHQAP